MSTPATYAASPNAISSQALAFGPMPSGLPDGATTDLFGLVPVRANLSARQAKELGLMTSGTSGPISTTSSKSAVLQSSLENRLQARTQTLGSTLYAMTWKPWVTASGRSRFRLRASVRRISETGFTGWPTPQARDHKGADTHGVHDRGGKGPPLNEMARMAGWPTCTATDAVKQGNVSPRPGAMGLSETVPLAGWGTPTASEPGGTGDQYLARSQDKTGNTFPSMLTHQVAMAGWRTPTAGLPNSLRGNGQDPAKRLAGGHAVNLTDEVNWLKDNPQAARLTVSGQMLTGSSAGMDAGGQLNPAHSRWLMGLPPEWDACALMAMPSSRKPQKHS